ncbi:MAG TPA: hypothetical protein VGO50_07290 [Pyrinomonadaceae bacterium]|jgi:hypothetical protein|nr:hypothetical protein [Pyrinomonadaceae bacterium]
MGGFGFSVAAVKFTEEIHYTSMRVHGNSAHVQAERPEAPRQLTIEYQRQGTLAYANYDAHMTAHFSIPTPLSVERTESILGFSVFQPKTEPVFKESSVWVDRVEIYLTASNAAFGMFWAMDGNQTLFKGKVDPDLNFLISNDDLYYEKGLESVTTYGVDIGKRVKSGLGLSFEMNFTQAAIGDPDRSRILLIGAKAIFSS